MTTSCRFRARMASRTVFDPRQGQSVPTKMTFEKPWRTRVVSAWLRRSPRWEPRWTSSSKPRASIRPACSSACCSVPVRQRLASTPRAMRGRIRATVWFSRASCRRRHCAGDKGGDMRVLTVPGTGALAKIFREVLSTVSGEMMTVLVADLADNPVEEPVE